MNKDRTKTDLQIMLFLFIISFCAFGALTFYIIERIKINGEIHTQIKRGQELVADILPPPGYIIETHLYNSEIANKLRDTDPSTYLNSISKFESAYNKTKEYWKDCDPRIQAKFYESDKYISEYFGISKNDFLKTLAADQKQKYVVYSSLDALFLKHKAVIVDIVKIQKKLNYDIEEDTRKLINNTAGYMIGTALILILLVTFTSIFLGKRVTFYNKRLSNVMKQQDEFYSLLGRDLRSSIWNVSAILSAINEKGLEQTQKESMMKSFEEQYQKIYVLLDNLMELKKLNFNSAAAEKHPANIVDVINEAMGPLEEIANQKNVIITKNLIDCQVKIDHRMLSSVFRNLISNSIKSVSQNGKIDITNEVTNSTLTITIKDNSSLTQNDQLKKLLQTTGNNPESVASELWLMVNEELVKRNGGRFYVEKNMDFGNVYKIEFDLKK